MKLMSHDRPFVSSQPEPARVTRLQIEDWEWRRALVERILQDTGWRQSDLAHYLGIRRTNVHRWLRGERPVPARWLGPLIKIMGSEA